MATRNDITGDTIASRGNSDAYKNNWDAIFGKKKATEEPVVIHEDEDEPKDVQE